MSGERVMSSRAGFDTAGIEALVSRTGTSMAALIAQFFAQKRYPTFKNNEGIEIYILLYFFEQCWWVQLRICIH
jgi:hypothetical protein